MTESEALTLAVLRVHFGCTFSKLEGLARAIWGLARCQEIAGSSSIGSLLGRDLVSAMESILGFDRCETDKMVLNEVLCLECKGSQWSMCYPSDTAKECGYCGKMACVLPSRLSLIDEEE